MIALLGGSVPVSFECVCMGEGVHMLSSTEQLPRACRMTLRNGPCL